MLLHEGKSVWLIHEEESLLEKQLLAPAVPDVLQGLPAGSTTGTKEVVSGIVFLNVEKAGDGIKGRAQHLLKSSTAWAN